MSVPKNTEILPDYISLTTERIVLIFFFDMINIDI